MNNSWWGKIIGGGFGLMFAGTFGGLLGVYLGHKFDRGLRLNWIRMNVGYNNAGTAQIQHAFFKATFAVMGHVAKSDGRVSESEIQVARQIMRRLGLNATQKQQAVEYFNLGKQTAFDFEGALSEFMLACQRQRILLQMFVEFQYQTASAEGTVAPSKLRILEIISRTLGVRPAFSAFNDFFSGANQQQHSYHRAYQTNSQGSLQEAYDVLGVNQSTPAPDVKRAYRKLMSQNHPDKLVSQGLPEEMIKLATEKTQNIQKAYDQIKQTKGF